MSMSILVWSFLTCEHSTRIQVGTKELNRSPVGNEDTNEILKAECFVVRCAAIHGIQCRILHFTMCHTFSVADKQVSLTPGLSTQPCRCNMCRLFLASLCGNKHGCPWNRQCLKGSMCCSKMVPSQMCKSPMPGALIHPYTTTDLGYWTLWR